jgi:protein-tyrosine kinase
MSRVDDALRRALVDPSGGTASTGVEPAATAVDDSALARYVVERRSDTGTGPSASPAAAVRRACAVPTPSASRVWKWPKPLDSRLVISPEASVGAVEQYRRLATVLLAGQAERTLKTLMVSSAMPHEGKTLTVTNLALTLSESYARRVLLIDADFRHPSLHKMFGMPNAAGLVEGLRSSAAPLRVLHVSNTLSVLPAGVTDITNSMAELSSDRMRQLVTEVAAQFDWVLIDTAPVGLLSDARLLARHVDGVLFVIAAGSTPYPIVQRAIDELGSEHIVGTVLNRVEARELPSHHHYDHYYNRRT